MLKVIGREAIWKSGGLAPRIPNVGARRKLLEI